MKPIHTVLPAVALALSLPFPALAHDVTAQSIEMTYKNATYREAQVSFTNPEADLDNAILNLCVAKDTLPANWDTQQNKLLRTDSMCKEAPFYGDDGDSTGRVIFGISKGKHTDSNLGAEIPAGRYIVSVWLYMDNPDGHHNGGNHPKLALVTLAAPTQ